MSNEWNIHRTAVTTFAVAVTLAAFVTTLEHIDIRIANDEA